MPIRPIMKSFCARFGPAHASTASAGPNIGYELAFQHTKLAYEAFLLLLTQAGISTSPQQAVPPPCAGEKALGGFLLGARGPRGVDDIQAETVEHLPLLALRETNDEAFSESAPLSAGSRCGGRAAWADVAKDGARNCAGE